MGEAPMPQPMDQPRITLVTPSYNQGPYLETTIRSILDQGYPNLEYIIVDGGSTDESVDIIKRYQDQLAWWVSEKDRGQSHAINKGFERATGEIYCYINSDDTLKPGALDAVAEAWNQGHEFITGWVVLLEPDGGEWPQLPFGRSTNPEWLIWNPLCQQATYWAARFTKQLGPFREDLHYCFDYEFWMRLWFVAKAEPHMLKRCMGGYRLHEASKTVSQLDRFEPEFKKLRAEYRACLTPGERRTVDQALLAREATCIRNAGWESLRSGHRSDAREAARQLVRLDPFSPSAWRLVYCSVRGW
jgi:glycosyltransferase involved in cell wall biosynthesis